MLVGGLAPILAPLVGGQLLHVTDWRGIFVVLAGIGALLLIAAWAMLAETLPAARRHRGGLVATLHVFRLVRDRPFMGYTLSAGLTFAAMATYISGSPFVLQDIHGVSPQLFSVLFAFNAVGIMLASQVSRSLVGRRPARHAHGRSLDRRGGRPRRARLGGGRPRPRGPAADALRDGLERRHGAAQRGRARWPTTRARRAARPRCWA
jgi:MFS family permease